MTMRINDDNIEVRRNSMQAWLLAARPKTLSGAAVPVMLGISLAVNDTQMAGFMPVPALLCVLFAFLMQIDANFINDYFDCVDKGFQSKERVQVVVRPEDFKIVPADQGKISGIVESVIFKGVHYEIMVDAMGYKWKIHTTQYLEPGTLIGMNVAPMDIHIMKRTEE